MQEQPNTQSKPTYFDPKAPGVRGAVGLVMLFFSALTKSLRTNFNKRFSRLSKAQQLIIANTAKLLLLVCVIGAITIVTINTIGNNEAPEVALPALQAALISPYTLPEITINPNTVDAEATETFRLSNLFYSSFGDYTFQNDTLETLPPDKLNQCLTGGAAAEGDICVETVTLQPRDTLSARFENTETATPVDVLIGYYRNHETLLASQLELLNAARRYGRVNDFVIGETGDLDYFYFYQQGWYSFTWFQDVWVFSVSARSVPELENMIKQLQFSQPAS